MRYPRWARTEETLSLAQSIRLDGLAQLDARKAKLVELRFCGGSCDENGAQSVMRDWKMVRMAQLNS
jgi:hypothetical protein